MPIGSKTSGVATGPALGPRYVDPAAGPGGFAVPGAAARPSPAFVAELPVDTISGLVFNGPTRLLGWSLSEEVAAGAKVIIRDGNGAGAPAVAVVGLAADETNREWFGPDGILINTGIYIQRLTGTTMGAFYHRP